MIIIMMVIIIKHQAQHRSCFW